ncbi:MAG: hypothetical protein AB1Z98_12445 [Nannocystaceae bacterium]
MLEAAHIHASGPAALVAAQLMLERRDEYTADDRGTVDLERLFY